MTFPEGYEVDHKMPISKGGLHYPSNLQHLPMPENRRKGAKLLQSGSPPHSGLWVPP